jgi:hypothetical protein
VIKTERVKKAKRDSELEKAEERAAKEARKRVNRSVEDDDDDDEQNDGDDEESEDGAYVD